MGIFNWLMHRSMRKEAIRLAKIVSQSYSESKQKKPNLSDKSILMEMAFDKEGLAHMPKKSRERLEVCCETVQGFCYMMALDVGRMKGMMNFRSLQFTRYMDLALESFGLPPQTKEQKECILEAMDLCIDGWEKFAGN